MVMTESLPVKTEDDNVPKAVKRLATSYEYLIARISDEVAISFLVTVLQKHPALILDLD